MASIRRFEDIVAWQRARAITKRIYEISARGDFRRDFGLRSQICRASVSIMANIAEGFERDSHGERIRFFQIAKGSAGEVRSHLYVAKDCGYLTDEEFSTMSNEITAIGKMIAGFMSYLKDDKQKNAREPQVGYNGVNEFDERAKVFFEDEIIH